MEQTIYANKSRQNSLLYKIFLVLSFVWLSIYPTSISFLDSFSYGFGNIMSKSNIGIFISSIFMEAIVSWIVFELLFWIYRWFLSFKIYSFIVPTESLKAETRLYFIFRNVLLGIVYNLCFFMPYLYSFSMLFDIVITMLVLIAYAKHLNSVYSETIVGHFVFKNFCYPVFVYEAIEIICSILVVV